MHGKQQQQKSPPVAPLPQERRIPSPKKTPKRNNKIRLGFYLSIPYHGRKNTHEISKQRSKCEHLI